jgi:hypothetical protein
VEKHAENPPAPIDGTVPSLEELAACQGVRVIADFAVLLGRPSPGDESADEFAGMLREWRTESNGQAQKK